MRVERDDEELEEAETIHGSRAGSAVREDEHEDRPEKDMRARHDHDQAEEGRAVKTKRPSSCLSEAEWREHRVTHYPYRSWCPYCKTARGVAGKHKRGEPDEVTGPDSTLIIAF